MPRDYGTEYRFQPGARCSINQYRLLLYCSKEGDASSWNEWRQGHADEEVWLCGVDISKARLEKVNLGNAHLEGAVLAGGRLEGAILCDAHAEGAVFWQAHLEGANLWRAHMKGAKFWRAHLTRAALLHAHLEEAFFTEADLKRADLSHAHLEGAALAHARLQGAKLDYAKLHGADLQFALIDGGTKITDCEVDRETDFRGVGLDAGRVEPGLSQLLKYNIRRKRWREWYVRGPRWQQTLKRALVGSFWWMSDYGQSTVRICWVFLVLALAFAGVYFCKPGWVEGLRDTGGFTGAMHAFYFSMVTMTTLGYGDVHARPDVWQGQALLIIQVALGYVLLGALVTRLSVLFTAGGPAAHFSARKSSEPNPEA